MQTIRTITSASAILAVSLAAASAQVYQWTTIAGLAETPGSADGTNSAARFRRPRGLAVDYTGNVFVVDTDNSAIRKITPLGTNWVTTTIAGLPGSPGNADGTNSDARFNFCGGLAVDPDRGTIFVADTLNQTIRMITPLGTNWVVSTIAGQAGSAGRNDGTNSAARFYNPSGIAFGLDSGRHDVFVADTANSTVRMVTRWGTNWLVSTLAGLAGSSGSADGTNSAVRFQLPSGLAAVSASFGVQPSFHAFVFVADTGNSTLREFDFDGPYLNDLFIVGTLAGFPGKVGSDDGMNKTATFDSPAGVAANDMTPGIFVADWLNNTIRRLTAPGFNWYSRGLSTSWIVSTIGGAAGQPGYADGTNSDARFYWPEGIAVDDGSRVFVADTQNHTIRMGIPVVMPPVLQSLAQTNGIIYFTWSAASGCFYQVQYQTNLTQPNWNNLGIVQAIGSTATASVAAVVPGQPTDRQRFFRVVLLP